MNIPIDQNGNNVIQNGARKAAQNFGMQVSGKSEEIDPRRLEDETFRANEQEDLVQLTTEKEGQRVAQQHGALEDKKKAKEKEDGSRLSGYQGRDINKETFNAVSTGERGEEMHISPQSKLSEAMNRNPEEITSDLPKEIRKASETIVGEQINPDTKEANGSLKEIKPLEKTREIEAGIEGFGTIADIHDTGNKTEMILDEAA